MAVMKLPDRLNDINWIPDDGEKKDLIVDCLYFVHKIEVCYFLDIFLHTILQIYIIV